MWKFILLSLILLPTCYFLYGIGKAFLKYENKFRLYLTEEKIVEITNIILRASFKPGELITEWPIYFAVWAWLFSIVAFCFYKLVFNIIPGIYKDVKIILALVKSNKERPFKGFKFPLVFKIQILINIFCFLFLVFFYLKNLNNTITFGG